AGRGIPLEHDLPLRNRQSDAAAAPLKPDSAPWFSGIPMFRRHPMTRILLIASVALLAGALPGGPAPAQGYGYPPGYAPPPPPPPPSYSQAAPGPGPYSSGRQSYGGENCGTPDEPKPCPPLPRHPLPYYPANRP